MGANDINGVVDGIIEAVHGDIVVALPLGLGKPVEVLDALYQRVKQDQRLRLTILTALSLEVPRESDPIRGRLLNPVFERLFARYTEPQYLRDQRLHTLPENIQVKEFYFKPGSRMGNTDAQRHYISSNYTFAARDVAAQGCNVVMQLLAEDPSAPGRLSMSCNPDTPSELVRLLGQQGRPVLRVGVVHPELPYMYGDAEIAAEAFDYLLREDPAQHGLFPVPRLAPIPAADYAIGIHASALVADGGTLQLGIGAMGDAIVRALVLRHQQNDRYRQLLREFDLSAHYGQLIFELGGEQPFQQGLYGATEMFVEGFLQLFQAGILKRQVFDFWALQELINDGRCNPLALTPEVLPALAEVGVRELRGKDFAILKHHGFFNSQTQYSEGHIIAPDGQRFSANMANPESQRKMAGCLGAALRNGKVLHGGFFLGSDDFYRALRELPEDERQQLAMSGVEKINQLDVNPRLFRAQRRRARFINTGLNVSLLGAVASDTLENGQVVSGVGGQYNFVAMAHQLPESRSILMIRATRRDHGREVSNILWNYASCTIPRHLRDIVITEYGIADLRSKSDEEVIQALIKIADSRFQPELCKRAKAAGKLASGWQVPLAFQQNFPARVERKVAAARELLPPYPFGCDFSELDLEAAAVLQRVARLSKMERLQGLVGPVRYGEQAQRILARLGLQGKLEVRDRLLRRLIAANLTK